MKSTSFNYYMTHWLENKMNNYRAISSLCNKKRFALHKYYYYVVILSMVLVRGTKFMYNIFLLIFTLSVISMYFILDVELS